MSYPSELEQLRDRFKVFLQKLENKAIELYEEAAEAAQLMYDDDDDYHKRTYLKFKAGIEGQFQNIIDKVYQVFDTQILPLRNSNKYDFSLISDWYQELYDKKTNFEKSIYKLKDKIFDNVKEISAEVRLQEIWDEYEEVKNAFHCSQCGANLEIDQIYFVSTYITCPYCQTQNTFVPGSRMQMLQHIARDVAEERLQHLAKEQEQLLQHGVDQIKKKLSYNYYRAMVWVEKSKIVPVFMDEYAKVFMRELHESLSNYNNAPLKENPNLYKAQLEQFGYKKEMKPNVLAAYKAGDDNLLIDTLHKWDWLYQISAYAISNLYQGKEFEDLHNHHYQRVQSEWEKLSEINKAIKKQTMTRDEAIKEIETSF